MGDTKIERKSMGKNSAISWTEHTWNPWTGCTKISPGCKFCYMYRDKARYGQDPTRIVRSKTTFIAPLSWRDPAMVFTCSWSDFFIEEADQWREGAWAVIRETPHLTYQILTKRPERIADNLPVDWHMRDRWQHVWLGVSVESADYAWRLEDLLSVDAALHFASFEPLLCDVGNIAKYLPHSKEPDGCKHRKLRWAIIGGESGADRREMPMSAFEDLLEQLRGFVPVYVKQDSALHSGQQGRIPNELWLKEFPTSVTTKGAQQVDKSDGRFADNPRDEKGRILYLLGDVVTIPFESYPGPVPSPVQATVVKVHSPTYYEFEWIDKRGKIQRRSLIRSQLP